MYDSSAYIFSLVRIGSQLLISKIIIKEPLNSKNVMLNDVVNFFLMLTAKRTNGRLVEYASSYGERRTGLD